MVPPKVACCAVALTGAPGLQLRHPLTETVLSPWTHAAAVVMEYCRLGNLFKMIAKVSGGTHTGGEAGAGWAQACQLYAVLPSNCYVVLPCFATCKTQNAGQAAAGWSSLHLEGVC